MAFFKKKIHNVIQYYYGNTKGTKQLTLLTLELRSMLALCCANKELGLMFMVTLGQTGPHGIETIDVDNSERCKCKYECKSK